MGSYVDIEEYLTKIFDEFSLGLIAFGCQYIPIGDGQRATDSINPETLKEYLTSYIPSVYGSDASILGGTIRL